MVSNVLDSMKVYYKIERWANFHVHSSVVASTFMSCTEISLLGTIDRICMHRCQNIEKQVRYAKIKVSTVAI